MRWWTLKCRPMISNAFKPVRAGICGIELVVTLASSLGSDFTAGFGGTELILVLVSSWGSDFTELGASVVGAGMGGMVSLASLDMDAG